MSSNLDNDQQNLSSQAPGTVEDLQDVSVHVYTHEEMAKLEKIAESANDIFQPSQNKLWASKDELSKAVNSFAAANGFTVGLRGSAFFCSRADESISHKKRRESNEAPLQKRRKTQSARCGCNFVVKFTNGAPLVNDAPRGSLRVTDGSCFAHSNGCLPGANQLRCGNITAGRYTKMVFHHADFKVLFNLMRCTDQVVNAKIIRDILRPILPEGVPITSLFICNLRNKVRMSLQLEADKENCLEAAEKSLINFVNFPSTAESELESLDNFPADYIDKASRDARLVLRQALKETSDAARIEWLLQELAKREPGFQFRVAYDNNNRPCGYVWMTPWQRAAFEQYGDVIFLDCMKRKLNSVDWPYIGPVVLDGENKIAVIIESICCSERLEAYEFVLNAAFDFTPGRPRQSVKVIYGDGIMSDRLLVNLGIMDSCKLCLDTYHLLHVDWPRKFGVQMFQSMKSGLTGLVFSKKEEDYNVHYEELKKTVGTKPNFLKYLNEEIHGNRHKFSQCYVRTYEGNLRRLGDSPAEANHSSFVRRIGPGSSEEPVVAIVQMLERMKDMATEKNSAIARYHLQCLGESATLRKAGDTIRADVLTSLSPIGFDLWSTESKEAQNYIKRNALGNSGLFEIQRVNSEAEPRIVGANQRCNCEHRVSMMAQCRHELCAFGFRLHLFAKRYHQQAGLAVSDAPSLDGSLDECLKEMTAGDEDPESSTLIASTDNPTANGSPQMSVLEPNATTTTKMSIQDHAIPTKSLTQDGVDDTIPQDDDEFSIQNQSKLSTQQEQTENMANDDDDGDILSTTSRQEGNEENKPARVARNGKPSKADYRTYMDICNDLWGLLKSRDEINNICGVLLKLKEFARTNEINNAVTLEERLNSHLSCFASYRGPNELFSQTSSNNNMSGIKQSLEARTAITVGRSRTVRLKPTVELVRGTRQPPKCTFCKERSHNLTNCPSVNALEAKRVRDPTQLGFYLGDPDVHQVMPMPHDITVQNIDWEGAQVPLQAVHVVLNAVYKIPDTSNDRGNATQESQENIVDATFLGQNGKALEGVPHFYKAKFVRQWISTKAAKKMVFTKLLPPNNKTSNDYVYNNSQAG